MKLIFSLVVKLLDFAAGPVAGSLADAYQSRLSAATDSEKIAAEERVRTIEHQAKVHGRYESLARFILISPYMIYLFKVILYDKVLGLGTTDDLSENLWYIFFALLGFFTLRALKRNRYR